MSIEGRVKRLELSNEPEPDPDRRPAFQFDYKKWAENATDAEIFMHLMQSTEDGEALEDKAKLEHVGLRLLLAYMQHEFFAVECVTSVIDHPERYRGWVVPPPRQGWQLVEDKSGNKYSQPNGLRTAGGSFSEWANKRMIDQDGVTPKTLPDVREWVERRLQNE